MPIKKKGHVKETNVVYSSKQKPSIQIRSVLRNIGNSTGVIITRKMMEVANLKSKAIFIEAFKGEIRIRPVDETMVNTDLSSWGKQFESAIKSGHAPEDDLFLGMKNAFDEEEW